MKLLSFVVLIPLALIAGCTKNGSAPVVTTTGKATLAVDAAELAPQTPIASPASVILNGQPIKVDVKTVSEGGSLRFDLKVHEESLATEEYRFAPGSFEFVGTSGETYDPPVRLLSYPVIDGATSSWQGVVAYGDIKQNAKAQISTRKDVLNLAGGNFDAILAEVKLTYGEGKQPTVRSLKFWFAPKKGVIKRELGMNSTREPLVENAESSPTP